MTRFSILIYIYQSGSLIFSYQSISISVCVACNPPLLIRNKNSALRGYFEELLSCQPEFVLLDLSIITMLVGSQMNLLLQWMKFRAHLHPVMELTVAIPKMEKHQDIQSRSSLRYTAASNS